MICALPHWVERRQPASVPCFVWHRAEKRCSEICWSQQSGALWQRQPRPPPGPSRYLSPHSSLCKQRVHLDYPLAHKGWGILILKRKAILRALTAYKYAITQVEGKWEHSGGELHLSSATSKEDKLPRSLPSEQLRRAPVCQPPFPWVNQFSCGLRAASSTTRT